jgi:hypothetical protein
MTTIELLHNAANALRLTSDETVALVAEFIDSVNLQKDLTDWLQLLQEQDYLQRQLPAEPTLEQLFDRSLSRARAARLFPLQITPGQDLNSFVVTLPVVPRPSDAHKQMVGTVGEGNQGWSGLLPDDRLLVVLQMTDPQGEWYDISMILEDCDHPDPVEAVVALPHEQHFKTYDGKEYFFSIRLEESAPWEEARVPERSV